MKKHKKKMAKCGDKLHAKTKRRGTGTSKGKAGKPRKKAPGKSRKKTTKITYEQTLRRTQRMLRREWVLGFDPAPDKDLRKTPPEGLGKNDNAIEALETPIEAQDFADVKAKVTGDNLIAAELVGDSSKENLREVIWRGIPEEHKA